MYLWAFLVTAAVGLAASGAIIAVALTRRRPGARTPAGLTWTCLAAGVLGAVLLVAGLAFPQVRGRQPAAEGAAFAPTPFTDPLVLSAGLGAFAVAVGVFLVARGDRSRPTLAGLIAGAATAAVWLFYLVGRLAG